MYMYRYWILHECSCLLNLLNKLRKRDKMRGLPSILSLFFAASLIHNTGARMLDSILSYDIKIV